MATIPDSAEAQRRRLASGGDATPPAFAAQLAPGKAAALSSFLAQGGGRPKYSKSRGWTYRSGALKGLNQEQAVAKFQRMWAGVDQSVRDKYARIGGMGDGTKSIGSKDSQLPTAPVAPISAPLQYTPESKATPAGTAPAKPVAPITPPKPSVAPLTREQIAADRAASIAEVNQIRAKQGLPLNPTDAKPKDETRVMPVTAPAPAPATATPPAPATTPAKPVERPSNNAPIGQTPAGMELIGMKSGVPQYAPIGDVYGNSPGKTTTGPAKGNIMLGGGGAAATGGGGESQTTTISDTDIRAQYQAKMQSDPQVMANNAANAPKMAAPLQKPAYQLQIERDQAVRDRDAASRIQSANVVRAAGYAGPGLANPAAEAGIMAGNANAVMESRQQNPNIESTIATAPKAIPVGGMAAIRPSVAAIQPAPAKKPKFSIASR